MLAGGRRASPGGIEPVAASAPQAFLAAARQRYADANPASAAAHAEARAWLPGGNTRTVLHVDPFPLYFARASGSELVDLDGHRYADFLNEFTSGLYGHSHPRLLATLAAVGRNGTGFGGQTSHETRLARLLVERFPALEMVRFTNSGTEANLMALGAARVFTGRDTILVFSGGYHGGPLNFTRDNPANVSFDWRVCRYNDCEGTRRLLRSCGDRIAAILVEPMLQSGGCIPADPAFLAMLREEASRCGALLIFDEIVTSRLAPDGLHGRLGLTPDLLTLGKYVGGGLACGVFGGRRDVMRRFDPTESGSIPHAGTFNNHVLTMALGYEGLSEIFTPAAAAALNRRGDRLRSSLNRMCVDAGVAMQFSGVGSVMAVHFTATAIRSFEDVAADDPVLRALFYHHLLADGIYAASRGMLNLSLLTEEAQIERLGRGVTTYLQEYGALLGSRAGSVAA